MTDITPPPRVTLDNEGKESTSQPDLDLQEEKKAFDAILKMLLDRQGVDFSHYRQSTVLRRFVRRMALGRNDSFTAYLARLQNDEQELLKLHHDLLLFFTEFFRDSQVFDALKVEVFPALMQDRSAKDPIRVWVPGCSTGEEVYSLAICLYEFLEANRLEVNAQFFGTDLVEDHVRVARAALYPVKIVQHVSPTRLERFFDNTEQGYRVTKRIREMCVFATQDITIDPPFPNIDLVSCRNLLIYFDATFQGTVIPLFHFALKPAGFLLLGTSETLDRYADLFAPVNKHCNIFVKRPQSGKIPYRFPSNSTVFNPKIKGASEQLERAKANETSDLTGQIEKILLDRYAPPGVLVDSNMQIRQFRGRTSKYLDPPAGEASLKLSKMAGHSLMPDIFVAIEEVKKTGNPARKRNIPFLDDDRQNALDISVLPVRDSSNDLLFLILFEEIKNIESHASGAAPEIMGNECLENTEMVELRKELMATKEYLQTIIEEKDEVNQELWTANEEVQSTNEELQSVNEELEAAKEELESSNEELIALNEELYQKNTELTEANGFNESTINGSMDGILTFDTDFKIKIWNPAMEQMWGLKKEFCLDRSLLDLFPFLSENGHKEVLLSVLQGKPAIIVNQPYYQQQQRKPGFFEGRYSPLRDFNNAIIGGLAIIHDSTERKLAEEQLREREEHFKMVMQQSPEAIGIYNLQGILINANRAYEELWGVSGDTVINTFSIIDFAQKELSDLLPLLTRAYAGETVFVPEYQQQKVNTATASKRWLSTRIYPLTDSTGNVKNIVISSEDVTARKQAEEDLQKIQKLESIGTLAGGIAHDFNNILMGVFGNLAIAKNELDKSHPAMEHLLDAQSSMNRATRLTQQLLIFAKGGSPVREGLSIGTLVEEVVRFDLSGSNVKPVFDIANDLWVADVDKNQIQQVFSNLTVNAKQAMAKGGHLFVTLQNRRIDEGEVAGLKAGGYIKAVVRDEGIGILKQYLNQIFDPYFTTNPFGRGLGLATTYTILKKHGGWITVESTPGVGTAFTFYLPVAKDKPIPESSPTPEERITIPRNATPRILIMDDEPMVCKVATKFLEREGYIVDTARDGKEAIEKYRQSMASDTPFAVVIMDLTIPGGMGGREAVQKILELHTDARVIVSSGYAEDPVMADYANYGFCGIVAKPYTGEKLITVVQQALSGR